MNETEIIKIVMEVALIVAAIYGAYWKQKVENESRFTKLEVLMEGLSQDHKTHEERLHGMSRHLAELTGHVKGKK